MHEHGSTGRTFAGRVTQLITGSAGLDDYEWGVTLFAVKPDDLKEVVYTMRFDRASALYAEFGPFYVGYVVDVEELAASLLRQPASAADEHRSGRDVAAIALEGELVEGGVGHVALGVEVERATGAVEVDVEAVVEQVGAPLEASARRAERWSRRPSPRRWPWAGRTACDWAASAIVIRQS